MKNEEKIVRKIVSERSVPGPSKNLSTSILERWKEEVGRAIAFKPLIPRLAWWAISVVIIGIVGWTLFSTEGLPAQSSDAIWLERASDLLSNFSGFFTIFTAIVLVAFFFMMFLSAKYWERRVYES